MAIPILCIVVIFIQGMFAEGAVKLGASLRPSASGQQQSWQSPGKNFSLGFHPSGERELYVVGISFANIIDSTLVWTAGFNGGIQVGEEGSFTLRSDGNLVLSNGTQIVWETKTSNQGVASADMQEDGDFVLQNDSSVIVWDTFANPTDSLVVDQKFIVHQSLRSGLYTFTLQSSGNFTLKWNNYITYLNEGTPLATTASLTSQGIFKLSNSSADSIWVSRSGDYTDNSITVQRIKLEANGNLRSFGWVASSGTWQPGWTAVSDQCKVYGWCGSFGVCAYNDTGPFCECPSADFDQIDPNDASKGCRRQHDIAQCSNNQSMVQLDHTEFLSYPPESESNSEIYYLGTPDCWQNCLRNPSCTASTIMADGTGTCRIKTSNFTGAYQALSIPATSYVKVCGQGRPLPPPPPPVRIANESTVPAKLGASLRPSASGQQQSWQSPGNNFSLGFHQNGNRGLYVVGISYANINDSTLVWTAGFNGGIEVGEGASFTMQNDGNLVLSNGTQIVWQTNTSNLGVASVHMQDDGNFVLQNTSSVTVWDTFGNPTDSLVVNQNIIVNQTLQSGPYTFTMHPSGNFTLQWNNTITYLNEGIPLATTASLTGLGIFKLSNSSSDSIWVTKSADYNDSSTTVRRMKLEPDGNFRSYGWVPKTGTWQAGWSAVDDQCKVYGWCGNYGVCDYNDTGPYCECPSGDFDQINPNDASKGCRRQQDITQCSNNQSMFRLDHTEFLSYPPESESNSEIYNLGNADCSQKCLENPSCTASTAMNDGTGYCKIKTSNFASAYQTASISSTSYVKVCGTGLSLPPPPPRVRIVDESVPAIGIVLLITINIFD